MGYSMLKNRLVERNYAKGSLEAAALTFLRESCEELRFDKEKASRWDVVTEERTGASIGENQIPYNMEKDIDRLCLENAVNRFLQSGKKEDAFDVYFCYLEMFVGDYEKTRRMIELLSEFEANGSSLLMKHRDHYSHSVYVFVLGLAIYQSNSVYRKTYNEYYKLKDEKEASGHFLKHWGMTSLFHDIGYPFELPFEQVASYFEVDGVERQSRPFVAYHELDSFVKLDKAMQRRIAGLYGLNTDKIIGTTDELFAYCLHQKIGEKYYFSEEEMLGFLKKKPTEPNRFGHFMDHAYFSATVLFKKLFCELRHELTAEYMDALTAILLHNSLYKFSVAFYKNPVANIRLKPEWHPLAYMLMLCDELQCWDRTAYGRNSKLELHPMECEFDFSDGVIYATYVFDKNEHLKIDRFEKELEAWETSGKKGKKPKLKAYASMKLTEQIIRNDGTKALVNEFQADIERILDLCTIPLQVNAEVVARDGEKRRSYLSDSNYINLYRFATILNGVYDNKDAWKQAKANKEEDVFLTDEKRLKAVTDSFNKLSLEYKLYNINQAKAFARFLNEIGCFYTDKPVDFPMVEKFSADDLAIIGPLEHHRWLQEHYDMGWVYGTPEKEVRELERKHKDMIPDFPEGQFEVTFEQARDDYYYHLKQDTKDKDTDPMECMLAMLKMFDGLRIYRMK